MYKIIQAPSEILSKETKPVNFDVSKIVKDMTATLLAQKDPEGVGLAANQVGLPYRLFLARFTTKKTEPVRVFINPEIIEHSKELQPQKDEKHPLEGCLSIPKFYGVVKRWKWVKLQYKTISNHPTPMNTNNQSANTQKLGIENCPLEIGFGNWIIDCIDVFEGFPAVVIQHEMDHLDGHLFMEKLLEQKAQIFRITGRDKKGKEEWEEVRLQ